MKKLKRNLAEEEDFGRWWKILSQVKVKKTRMDWQIKGMLWERKASNSFRNEINKRTCMYLYLIISTIFFAICSVFFKDQRKKDESEFEPGTASSFQMTPALHWRAKTNSAFNFDLRTNFQHGAFAFWFHFLWKVLWKTFAWCHMFSLANKIIFLWCLSLKSLDLHLFHLSPKQ